jgi:transmembrane channel-like protein
LIVSGFHKERDRFLIIDSIYFTIFYSFSEVDRDKDDDEDATADASGKPLTRQHLLNKIREKKEVINKLRCQAWNMNRKRRTLRSSFGTKINEDKGIFMCLQHQYLNIVLLSNRLAQKYLEQNESKVSKTHLYKEELVKRWRQFLRWLGNIWIYFVPWESRIKRIESQFGSVVSSYFTFLRWVIVLNFAITVCQKHSVLHKETSRIKKKIRTLFEMQFTGF